MEISLKNYNILLLEIQKLVGAAEQNLAEIVNRQKIETSWQIGKIVDEYLVQNDGPENGENLFTKLESDLSIRKRALYEMRAFYKAYPELPSSDAGLLLSHYKTLASVEDSQNRKYLENFAIKNSLSVSELRQEVGKTKETTKKTSAKTLEEISESKALAFNRGNLFTYKIKEFPHSKQKFVDCGFNIFHEVETDLESEIVVQSTKSDDQYSLSKYSKESSKLYTYKAYLEKVVDGDTLRVVLDLGFKIQHREILRLSKINAPESKTSAGQESLEGLKEILKNAPFLIVKTNQIDIYGRYIADVFFSPNGESDAQKTADEGLYLSQVILNLGLAQHYG
jgi:hypothetical protein